LAFVFRVKADSNGLIPYGTTSRPSTPYMEMQDTLRHLTQRRLFLEHPSPACRWRLHR
jgi:hypothetical protein